MWILDRCPDLQKFGNDGWYSLKCNRMTLKCGIPWPGIPIQMFYISEFVEDGGFRFPTSAPAGAGAVDLVEEKSLQ